jgi:hypothetical protein
MKKILLILIFSLCINLTYSQQTDCSQSNGTFSYYAVLIINSIPNEFDKTDFINHIVSLDNISAEDLTTLNDNITDVFKSFPTAQSAYLQRVVNVSSNVEIYSILEGLNNSIEYHECTEEGTILGLNDNEYVKNVFVYPNPISEKSIVELTMFPVEVTIEIINGLGQIIFTENVIDQPIFEFKNIKLESGIYYIKISDLNSGISDLLKIVKR